MTRSSLTGDGLPLPEALLVGAAGWAAAADGALVALAVAGEAVGVAAVVEGVACAMVCEVCEESDSECKRRDGKITRSNEIKSRRRASTAAPPSPCVPREFVQKALLSMDDARITPVADTSSPRRHDRTLLRVPGVLRTLPTQSPEHGQARRLLRHSPDHVPTLDVTASLSGHSGCVNALSWSEDGQRLVSGSDDFRLCVWRMGALGAEAGDGPNLGLALETVVRTGHSRNSVWGKNRDRR